MTLSSMQGVRGNLAQLYSTLSEASWTGTHGGRMLFALAFMHSQLRERRRFRTLGYSSPCDFCDTDFQARARPSVPCPVHAVALQQTTLHISCNSLTCNVCGAVQFISLCQKVTSLRKPWNAQLSFTSARCHAKRHWVCSL